MCDRKVCLINNVGGKSKKKMLEEEEGFEFSNKFTHTAEKILYANGVLTFNKSQQLDKFIVIALGYFIFVYDLNSRVRAEEEDRS